MDARKLIQLREAGNVCCKDIFDILQHLLEESEVSSDFTVAKRSHAVSRSRLKLVVRFFKSNLKSLGRVSGSLSAVLYCTLFVRSFLALSEHGSFGHSIL